MSVNTYPPAGGQVADPTLTALAGVTTAADTLPYFTGVDTADAAPLTALGREVLAAADTGAAQEALLLSSPFLLMGA